MPPIKLELASPCEDDAKLYWKWRQDPQVIAASFSGQLPPWESFYQNYLKLFKGSAFHLFFFIVYENRRVGTLQLKRFPWEGDSFAAELSLLIDNNYRGQGLAKAAIKKLLDQASSLGLTHLIARVKKDNLASCALFKSCQFASKEQAECIEFQKNMRDQVVSPVFVIAEAGSNWKIGNDQESEREAFALIKAAKEAGADAVKFQVFRAHKIYAQNKNQGQADYLKNRVAQKSIHELFKEIEMPYGLIKKLYHACEDEGIEFMASCFSKQDFDQVDPYVKRHKIASYELAHLELLDLVAQSQKPLLLSTGACDEEEIAWALNYYKGKIPTLLQCCAQYPASPRAMNLSALPYLAQRFDCPVGLSDHSLDPFTAPLMAVALGATVIEKHFTLNKAHRGPDHYYAIDPVELKAMTMRIREAEKMRGKQRKQVEPEEQELFLFAKRAIQATRAIKEGERLCFGENMELLRPGSNSKGEHPRYLYEIEGKLARRALACGEGIYLNDCYSGARS